MYRLVLGRKDADPLIVETTQDLDRMAAQLDAIEPAGAEFQRFIRDNRKKLDAMTPLLRRPIKAAWT